MFLLDHDVKCISEDISQELFKATVGYLGQIGLGLSSDVSMIQLNLLNLPECQLCISSVQCIRTMPCVEDTVVNEIQDSTQCALCKYQSLFNPAGALGLVDTLFGQEESWGSSTMTKSLHEPMESKFFSLLCRLSSED